MRLVLSLIMVFCLAPAIAAGGPDTANPPGVVQVDLAGIRARLTGTALPANTVIDAACCKVCSKGKACGNSCISRSKQCHKPRGCACDG